MDAGWKWVCYARLNHDREGEKIILHRIFSAVFGVVLGLAGLVAMGYLQVDFKRDTLLSGAVGLLVPGVLMLSAFYMAFRFLKFAATGKEAKRY